MALLVFTDFICWAPIAFFALLASFGVYLISLEQAKVTYSGTTCHEYKYYIQIKLIFLQLYVELTNNSYLFQVFTIFVLPLNSCCNPFLYAILTKQFKKDCVMICKTIEESRVRNLKMINHRLFYSPFPPNSIKFI